MPKWVPFMIALVAAELTGDVMAKEFGRTGQLMFSVLSIGFVVAGNLSWQVMMRGGLDLARGGVLFGSSVALGATLIGLLWYGERLGWSQALGLCLGIAAIGLLSAE